MEYILTCPSHIANSVIYIYSIKLKLAEANQLQVAASSLTVELHLLESGWSLWWGIYLFWITHPSRYLGALSKRDDRRLFVKNMYFLINQMKKFDKYTILFSWIFILLLTSFVFPIVKTMHCEFLICIYLYFDEKNPYFYIFYTFGYVLSVINGYILHTMGI